MHDEEGVKHGGRQWSGFHIVWAVWNYSPRRGRRKLGNERLMIEFSLAEKCFAESGRRWLGHSRDGMMGGNEGGRLFLGFHTGLRKHTIRNAWFFCSNGSIDPVAATVIAASIGHWTYTRAVKYRTLRWLR